MLAATSTQELLSLVFKLETKGLHYVCKTNTSRSNPSKLPDFYKSSQIQHIPPLPLKKLGDGTWEMSENLSVFMSVDLCYMEVASVRGVLWALSNMDTHGCDICYKFISFLEVFLLY